MLENLNPTALVIADNVRREAAGSLDRHFLASVRERGVLVPIVADRDEAGTVTVRYGHRRTLAAVEVGLESVPVDVRDEAQARADRIIDQLAENEHRADLSNSDRAQAIAQLALTGLSEAQIAKRAALPRKMVRNAVTVAGSTTASEHADTLTLEQAAALAQFGPDDEDEVARLVEAASEGRFEHVLSRIQRDREDEQAARELTEWMESHGGRIIAGPGGWNDHTPRAILLDYLTDAEGWQIDPTAHRTCPGHVGWISEAWKPTGPERDTFELPEGAVEVGEGRSTYQRINFACADWKANGHVYRYAHEEAEPVEATPEQVEARKAQRRRVIANNKAWDAAEPVRRQWLADLATRKTVPQNAERLIARALVEGWEARAYGWTPIGIEPEAFREELTTCPTHRRSLVIALCVALYRWESNTGRHTWRNPTPTDRAVLTVLSGWGYPLSEVEAEIVDPPAEADAEPDAEADTDPAAEATNAETAGEGEQDTQAEQN